jgi:hypothetical protein
VAKAQVTRTRAQTAREFDALRALWRLFTSVRWALILLAFLALTGLLGVLLPHLFGGGGRPPDTNFRREMCRLGAEAGSPDAAQKEEKDGSP